MSRRIQIFVLTIIFLLALISLWFLNRTHTSKYKAAAIYVVAHHDDWHLFMGHDFLKDAMDTNLHVILIITTSGSDQHKYSMAREAGVMASINYALAFKNIAPNNTINYAKIDGRTIPTFRSGNITVFFLRIPDGNSDGKGFAALNNVSLTKLQNGEIHDIMSADSLNHFKNWEALAHFVKDIVEDEIDSRPLQSLHIPDTSKVINPADHPDHTASAYLALDAFNHAGGEHFLYQEYNTELLPANLSPHDSLEQQQFFNSYNDKVTQIMGFCTTCYSNSYQKWCGRLYKRQN